MTDDTVPLPSWGRPEPTDRRRRALVIGGGAAAAVMVAVAAFAGVSSASDGGGYRTTVVSTEDVQRTLTGVGTIEPVDQAAVAFPVAGTVASVDVSVGSTVVAGQVLASLDTESLTTSLHQAEAKLASAELTLHKGLNGESTTGSGGVGGPTPSASSSPSASAASVSSASSSPSASTAPTSSTDTEALVSARHAVAAAQHQLDVDLAAAEQALADSTAACSPDSAVATSSSTSTTTLSSGPSNQACQDALAASLAAQQVVAADAVALQQAVNQLDAVLSSSSGSSGTPSGGGSTGTSSASASGSPSSGSSVTSADLIAYQKAVDAATAEVTVAQQALAQATIVSPISGTVTSVGLAVGHSVSTGSSTATVLVSGAGGYEVTTSVAVTDLPHVAVGQQALVVADGSTTELAARVVQISLVPNSSSSSTTYAVVLALTDPEVDLPNGGLARTTIVTGEVASATAVPTSAVTTTETGRSVTVLDGGKATTASVTVGTVGSVWTEITDGVSVGQTVVLADLSEALPGSATSSSSSSSTSGASGAAGGFTLPSGGSFTPPSGAGGGARPGR